MSTVSHLTPAKSIFYRLFVTSFCQGEIVMGKSGSEILFATNNDREELLLTADQSIMGAQKVG